MIVPDVNLLLYATFDSFPQHATARRWLTDALNGRQRVALTPVAVFGFLGIGTNRRVFATPLAVATANTVIRAWLAAPAGEWLVPGPRHVEIALTLAEEVGTAGNLTTDIQLAAHPSRTTQRWPRTTATF